jgi:Ras-related protein Rap-1A
MNTENNALKVAVLGTGGVGKSAITVKFVQGLFIDKYDPTIEDSYRKQVIVDGSAYIAEILDTAGTEQFTAMRDLYIKNAEGVMLVFSLTALASLGDLQDIYRQVHNINEDIPIVLCANKCDLVDDRIISEEECEEAAIYYNATLFETSAMTDKNIQESFMCLFEKVIEKRECSSKYKKKKRRCNIL